MAAGEAFASLSHDAGVTRARQLCVHLSVREASMEEIRPRPGAKKQSPEDAREASPCPLTARGRPTISPAHHKLQGVGEDPVEDESKAGS